MQDVIDFIQGFVLALLATECVWRYWKNNNATD